MVHCLDSYEEEAPASTRGKSFFLCPSCTLFPASYLEHPDLLQAPLNSGFLREQVDGVPTLHQVLASPAQL